MSERTPTDPNDIFMWRRIDDRLTTSGQPTEAQLEAIRDLGVTHVLNLGLHEHAKALPREEAIVSALGMEYIYMPVDFDDPTSADYERFCAAMRALDGNRIHVHCMANLRVSAFLYRYSRDDLLLPEASARAEMESIWRPGGAWAQLVGYDAAREQPHRFAGRDY